MNVAKQMELAYDIIKLNPLNPRGKDILIEILDYVGELERSLNDTSTLLLESIKNGKGA